jgi:UDP-N-acetylmuramoylalanine--D-glutamate ligase
VAGRHNCLNALAALAMGEALGWPMEGMLAGLRHYRGLPHRGELVARIDGVSYVNDSKGTNVGAALAAVQGADAPLVLIAGGLAKDQDFGPLGEALRGRARAVVLLGRDRELLRAALPAGLPAKDAADMEEAVGMARSLARAGDMVLLSPACASFDMFDGFEARGEAFRAAVEGLGHD